MRRRSGPDEWGGLIVPHKYMGPLPAFFYPVFQLMDYGVHSWDIRQGTGRAHALDGDAADLLVPFMFILWSGDRGPAAGRRAGRDRHPGHRGHNAGDVEGHRRARTAYSLRAGRRSPTCRPVLEFDPGSFVLTAFGRSNAGTVRGDAAVADRFLNLFFRI